MDSQDPNPRPDEPPQTETSPDAVVPDEPHVEPLHPLEGSPLAAPPQEGIPTGEVSGTGTSPSRGDDMAPIGGRWQPSYFFLAVVSVFSLAADIGSKLWAEKRLDGYPGTIQLWPNHVAFVLARNRGGAWGLLQGTSENVRRPFFLLVSVAAIAFIVTLYRRLHERQRALRWGLPLVLGGALGNVFDRIRYGHVIDFIDVHAIYQGHDHHWPTFNVADIAICVGVGLMAVDMITSKKILSQRPVAHSDYLQDASKPPGPPTAEPKP